MNLSQETDENLMLRFGRGEAAAFEFLYLRHESRVFRYLQRNLRNEAGANDLMQEVWFAVVRNAAGYKPTAKFTTWLFRITRNLVFNELRRKRHFADQTEEIPEPVERAEKEPDRVLLEGELQRAIQEAINQLPESQRMAIILRRYEEMPYEEIAKVMETSVPAVKSILFRARAELRERLEKYLG